MSDKTNKNIPTDVYKLGVSENRAQIAWDLKIRNGYDVVIYASKEEQKGYAEVMKASAEKASVFVNGSGKLFYRVSTVRKSDGTESQRSSQFCFVDFD